MLNNSLSKLSIGICPPSFRMITSRCCSTTSFHCRTNELRFDRTFKSFSLSRFAVSTWLCFFFFSPLSFADLELNTLTVRPSVLACACIKAALKGLCLSQIDDSILHTIPCAVKDLLHTQRLVEQFFQSCLQDIFPSPARRCLAVLDTSNTPSAVSPRVK